LKLILKHLKNYKNKNLLLDVIYLKNISNLFKRMLHGMNNMENGVSNQLHILEIILKIKKKQNKIKMMI